MRYRAAKALDDPSGATSRDLVTTKLAAAVWNCVSKYKSTIPNFPQSETCELLILDRSVDLVNIYLFSLRKFSVCLLFILTFLSVWT